MRILSLTVITGLLLNGLALPSMAVAEDQAQVCAAPAFTPDTDTPEKIRIKCGPYTTCSDTRKMLLDSSKEYKELYEQYCQKISESSSKIDELNQNSSYDQVASTADTGIDSFNKLLEANKRIRFGIPTQSERNVTRLEAVTASTPFKARANNISAIFKRAKARPEVLKTELIKKTDKSGVSNSQEAIAQLDTLKQGEDFVRALLLDKEKYEKAIQKLQQTKNDAINKKNNTRTPDGGTNDSGSGFNPMSLIPLAAPFASMLMQKKQDSGVSDSLPDTAAPTPLPGASLETKSQSQTPGTTLASPKTPDTQMHMPTENYGGGGVVEPIGGDITQGAKDGNGSVAGLGNFSSSSGSGASESTGSSTGGGKNDRKPAAATATTASEDTPIAGGGGGSAFTPPPASTEAEGGMKDMLHDMESTLEDTPTGVFAEADQQGANEGVGAENSESLFPRVRACYVRNLKKGFVLDGLGEKLPESESH